MTLPILLGAFAASAGVATAGDVRSLELSGTEAAQVVEVLSHCGMVPAGERGNVLEADLITCQTEVANDGVPNCALHSFHTTCPLPPADGLALFHLFDQHGGVLGRSVADGLRAVARGVICRPLSAAQDAYTCHMTVDTH